MHAHCDGVRRGIRDIDLVSCPPQVVPALSSWPLAPFATRAEFRSYNKAPTLINKKTSFLGSWVYYSGWLNKKKQKQRSHINLNIMRVAASERADPLRWQNLHDNLRLWVCTLIRASAEPARSREKERVSQMRTSSHEKFSIVCRFYQKI